MVATVHVDKIVCARAVDPATGDVITVSCVKYGTPHPATQSSDEFYVERAHNGEVNAAYGFESEQQAMDFVTGYPDAKDYTIYGVTSKRVPLGIPDGMVLRSPYSFTSAEVAKDKAKSDAQAKVDAETAHKQSIQDAVNAAIAERDRAQTSSHVNNPVVKPSDAKRD